MSLHRRFLSRFRKSQTSGAAAAGVSRRKVLSRATTPVLENLEVRQMLAITQAKFGADSDFTCIAKVIEEWAGVEMKG